MLVVVKGAPKAATEARSIIKTVIPGFKKISKLDKSDTELAIDALDTRMDLIGFGGNPTMDKLRRGLRGVTTILRTHRRRMMGDT